MKHPLRPLAVRLSRCFQHLPRLHAALKLAFLSVPPSLRGPQLIWDALVAVSRKSRPQFVLQIGANDGEQSDPVAHFIRKHHWPGLLVEPVPFIFQRLKRNYEGYNGLTFVNAAVADLDGTRSFYFVDDPDARFPNWVSGLGSFDREIVIGEAPHGLDLETHLREIEVPCVSLPSLLDRHKIESVDILVIDTQGFDHWIVLQIPFPRILPHIIIYEHVLLRPEDRLSCDEFLESHGYTIQSDRWDVLAIRTG